MPAEIVIVADLWAKRDGIDRLLELLEEEVQSVHANEPGVRKFALHRDSSDPLHIVMIEAFADEQTLAAHRETDAYHKLMEAIPALIDGRGRTVLTPLGYGDPDRGYLA
jgi:quinol monooxygenase YgiN